MTIPADLPLDIRTGDTVTLSVAFQYSTGLPLDITGRTYRAQLRTVPEDSETLASFTCTVVSAIGGTLTVSLPASTTATLPTGPACWDLEETYGTAVNTLLAGDVTVVSDVTR